MKKFYFVAKFSIITRDDERAYELAYAHDFDFDDLELVDEEPVDNSDEIIDEYRLRYID